MKHAIFGLGVLLETDAKSGFNVVLFDDMPTARRISYRVNLEILGLLPTEEIEKLTIEN